NTITNSKEDLKGITTRSGTAYQGPTIPTTFSSLPQVVERKTEVTNDMVPPTNNGSTKDVQPLVVQVETLMLNSKPVISSIIEPIAAPGNNQGRNQFFRGASHGPNPPPSYQAPSYPASVHQPSIPQSQVVTTTEFTNYMQANDAILKNMQTNITSLINSNLELKNMFGQFMKMNTASSLGSGTLP
nr:reverse transcriptase domain-containing protein [Tanacetum cinerariifolium]